MVEPIDSTAWTGDTSHRAASFTPEAKADIAKLLKWIGACLAIGAIVVTVAKEVM